MEFEDLQKIWTTQSETPLYTLNETAMQDYIAAKAQKTLHLTNVSELLLIIVYLGSGSFILFESDNNLYIQIMGAWIGLTAVLILITRARRIAGQKRFDKSMLGGLRHAASVAAYRVRLSLFMRWNIVPIAILVVLGLRHSQKSIWATALTAFLFACSFFVSRWEYGTHRAKKRELEMLIRDLSLQ